MSLLKPLLPSSPRHYAAETALLHMIQEQRRVPLPAAAGNNHLQLPILPIVLIAIF